jgi:hypothetical protein
LYVAEAAEVDKEILVETIKTVLPAVTVTEEKIMTVSE